MKIALAILHADPSRGGAERYTLDLAAALARRQHDVSLLATSFAALPPGVRRDPIDAPAATRARRYRQFLRALDARLSSMRNDIVHAMLPIHRCDIYHPHAGLAAAAVQKAPLTAMFNPRRRAMAEVERRLLESGDPPIVLSLSDYVKQEIRPHYPNLPDDRVQKLFNAVDLNRFEPAPARSGRAEVHALFVGQDFARKGLAQAVAAIQRLKDQDIRLTVVGKSDGSFHMPRDVDDRVGFAGKADDPRPFYRDADFLLLPTRHDPCSLVVLEALAMGVPVISTRFNGACEIMTDGMHGFVLNDPDDIDALAGAMKKLLDPQLRARMSAACLELRAKLSYEHHLDRLLEIYQQRIASRQ